MDGDRLLLVGLGNPGAKYADNRHNIGFMAVDAIARRFGFTPYRTRFAGELAQGRLGGEETLALRPMTFMNCSGRSVAEAARFYKIPPARVIVFHDELDLAAGKVRIKRGGGAAGHNGLRSIDALYGNDYRRVRLGIGHPGDKRRVLGYVLDDFDDLDRAWLDPLLVAVADYAPLLAGGEDAAFMSKVAMALAPPREKPDRKNAAATLSAPEKEQN
ncbi:MAG: aminoacyl-tRNA hydrolase [Rhodospirillales bacterium]|nr:aminoacyl-tRNA hydrolase [Rhodospirillales bacterium]